VTWGLETKKKFSKTTADIRHFVFFTQAEPALKICLRRLNLRKKTAYAGWACANNLPTQAEPALNKSVKRGNIRHFVFLRRLSLR
jgi:hypothetical protein